MKYTVAPFVPVATTLRLDEHVSTIGEYVFFVTVTMKLQLVLSPHESAAVVYTVVVPIGNVLPLGGADDRFNGELQPP